MNLLARMLVGLIAALHVYIGYFEMFAWEQRGPAIYSTFPPELFSETTVLAANQGLYNLFLAAGLIWSLIIRDVRWQANVATAFLLFVAIAGIYGAATASGRILFVQTAPALIALILVHLASRRSQ